MNINAEDKAWERGQENLHSCLNPYGTIFTMIIIGQNKQGFFMDEISTYGLANSFYEPFNNWTPEYYNQWNSSE